MAAVSSKRHFVNSYPVPRPSMLDLPNQNNQQSAITISNSFSALPLLRDEMNFPWQSG